MDSILGMLIFCGGGLAGATFLLPARGVKGWAYETWWMFYCVFGLLLSPAVVCAITVPDFWRVATSAPAATIMKCVGFGVIWGIGGLTWGLMVRYLGIGLGLAIGCGLCAATGTVLPPVMNGEAASLLYDANGVLTTGKLVVLAGVVASLAGIGFVGYAGKLKENGLPEEEKRKAVAEFDFRKGMVVAFISGVCSACMNLGLQSGRVIEAAALEAAKGAHLVGPDAATFAWQGMPVIMVVAWGGFLVQAAWVVQQHLKNRTFGDYFFRGPTVRNWICAALVGVLWVFQFVCQKAGEPLMGDLKYISFAIVMASTIFFSTFIGIFTGEWKGTDAKTRRCLAIGTLVMLVGFVAISLGSKGSSVAGSAAARSVRLEPGRVEVVVSPAAWEKNRAVRFAAEEMTNYLSRVLGRDVPVAWRPAASERVSLILGTNEWSAAAGIDVANLKRDGFVSGAKDGAVFIAGRDDPKFRPFEGEYDCEIATLYGVYDFLERYAGCRFYFPGELGEIVPKKPSLEVPEVLAKNEPDWKIRKIVHVFGAWFEPVDAREAKRLHRLSCYRLRVQTRNIPCCHGLGNANYSVRFGREHPEYFQLKNGKRTNEWKDDTAQYYHSMLCHTSGIWDEVYRDALSYFRGEGPEVRGRVHGTNRAKFRCFWGWNVAAGKYFDAMPQDGMSKCECPACQAAYAKAKDPNDWANELIWGNTVRLANRLKAAGFGDRYVTQMAYHPYRNVPDIDLPENVLVMVCSNGAWVEPKGLESDFRIFRAWNAKRSGNIWIWNNCGKHRCFNLNIADFPSVTPKAYGDYYKRLAPLAFGAFCSDESEKFLDQALNTYVFCRVAWDHGTDVGALLDEYYALMFGKAAAPMQRFFEIVEDKWMRGAIGNAVDTPLGSVPASPSTFQVWTEIYSPAVVAEIGRLFAEAAAAVPTDSLEGRRVALMKRTFLDPIVKRTAPYAPGAAARELERRAKEKPVSILKGFKPVAIEVTDEMSKKTDVYDRRFPLDVKPGKTYRVSYFVSCENAARYPDCKIQRDAGNAYLRLRGGVCGDVRVARKIIASVGGGITGTHRRLFQTFEFTVPDPLPPKANPQLFLYLYNRTGKALFEDLLVEEVVP